MIETLRERKIKGNGFVSGADYDTVPVPAVERTLRHYDRVRVYHEIAPDFRGIALKCGRIFGLTRPSWSGRGEC